MDLKQLVEKRMRTVFIGAISSIEDSPFGKLRKQSPEWEQVFQDLRHEILDKGNEQLRTLLDEVEGFNGPKRHKYYMPMFNSREEIEAYKRGQKDAKNNRGSY